MNFPHVVAAGIALFSAVGCVGDAAREFVKPPLFDADTAPRGDGGDGSGGDDSGGDDSGGDGSGGDGGDSRPPRPDDTGPPPAPVIAFDGERPRNVLMISWDTTRRDYLSPYSDKSETTPAILDLAARGVALDDHASCSNWTYASVLCVQTGLRPTELGFIPQTSALRAVPEAVELASERLDSAGYQTGFLGSNAFFGPDVGLTAGFDIDGYRSTMKALIVTRAAVDMLAGFDLAQPWYLHAHYMDPHGPYSPPASYLGALQDLDDIAYDLSTQQGYIDLAYDWRGLSVQEKALIHQHVDIRYTAGLRYTDDSVADLLAQADEMGALDDTLVVFWTDHGEQFYEHGSLGHGAGLYQEENAAAAIFWSKNIVPVSYDGPSTHVDIWPTVLEALGLSTSETDFGGGHVAGTRPSDVPRLSLYFSGRRTQQSAQVATHKLIYTWKGTKEFYDLSSDPEEQDNQYDTKNPIVRALWESLLPEVAAIEAMQEDHTPLDPGL